MLSPKRRPFSARSSTLLALIFSGCVTTPHGSFPWKASRTSS